MCGRYILRQQALAEHFWLLHELPKWHESFNIAPTQAVAVLWHVNGANQPALLRWGLVPFWARGVPPKYSTINATVEKIADAPTWRGPWKRGQRCILPASGFYEWQQLDSRKQPFFIHLADREHFGFAGLWDRSVAEDGTTIESCTIITLPASPLMAQIHNTRQRMPAILREEDHEAWLKGNEADAKAALKQYPDDLLTAYPISTRVNTPKNNGESLLEPVKIA
jgi:putative SOS response-associated peptidase YedK